MIDDYAANYVFANAVARAAYTEAAPEALETWVDQYRDAAGDRLGLPAPFVPCITDDDLASIVRSHAPEAGYDPALSSVHQYQRSRRDVLIDRGTHVIYVPLPSYGVVKQSALVSAMRAYLARPTAPVATPAPVAAPPQPVQPHWYGGAERHELIDRGYKVVGLPPAAHATSLDYLPTARGWLDMHEHALREKFRNVPARKILEAIVANTLLGLERE